MAIEVGDRVLVLHPGPGHRTKGEVLQLEQSAPDAPLEAIGAKVLLDGGLVIAVSVARLELDRDEAVTVPVPPSVAEPEND